VAQDVARDLDRITGRESGDRAGETVRVAGLGEIVEPQRRFVAAVEMHHAAEGPVELQRCVAVNSSAARAGDVTMNEEGTLVRRNCPIVDKSEHVGALAAADTDRAVTNYRSAGVDQKLPIGNTVLPTHLDSATSQELQTDDVDRCVAKSVESVGIRQRQCV